MGLGKVSGTYLDVIMHRRETSVCSVALHSVWDEKGAGAAILTKQPFA